MNSIYQKELQEEVEAYRKEEKMRNSRKHSAMVKAAEIEEKIGVPVPNLKYLPEGMFSESGDSSYSWNFDGEILLIIENTLY